MKTLNELYNAIIKRYDDSELRRGLIEAVYQLSTLSIRKEYLEEIIFNIASQLWLEEGEK
jgi:hypothetical protein